MCTTLENARSTAGRRRLVVGAGAYLAILYLFGGGNTVFGLPTLLVLLTTVAFVTASPFLIDRMPALWWPARAGLLLIVIVPVLQLVPLPPAIWHHLPGQDLRLDVLRLIGAETDWQPISMTTSFTTQSAVMATGFAVLALGFSSLTTLHLHRVAGLTLLLVVISILVGVVQIATHGAFPQFYENSDTGALIGFFANKNHMALAICNSIAIAWMLLRTYRSHRAIGKVIMLLFFVYWSIALIAIIATGSRAGLGIGLLVSTAIALSLVRGLKGWQLLLITTVAGGMIAAVMTSSLYAGVTARFGNVSNDDRWRYALESLPLARRYWAFGAGGGSFSDLFMATERLEWVAPVYVNHVHNEYIEIIIEYGTVGVITLAVMFAAVAWPFRNIRRVFESGLATERYTGLMIVAAIALHSTVDYPLRRPAMLGMLALALGLLWHRPSGSRGPCTRGT